MGRPMSPVNLPPKSPEKPLNPEWLKRPVMDDELPPDVGTPLVIRFHSFVHFSSFYFAFYVFLHVNNAFHKTLCSNNCTFFTKH